MKRVRGALGALAWVLGAALALRAGAAAADDASLSAKEQQGKRLFNHTCIYCHGPGVWGTNRLAKRMDKEHALLEGRTDLSAGAIEAIVRNGIGSMPPLRKTELSDSDVAAIAAYLTRKDR
jgi:mono/diheme cytochrome c family protein